MTVYHSDGEEPVSTTVVRSLGAITNTAPEEVPPLYDSVDPDALDRLIDDGADVRVRFEHVGYRITVTGTGEVRLEDAMAVSD